MASESTGAAPVLSSQEGRVLTLTLNRPERRNALTPELNQALIEALDRAGQDPGVGAVVITGAGGAFSAGLDLKEAATLDPAKSAETGERYFNGLIRALERCPRPLLAAVDGVAVGFGMSLAMACDLRYVSDRVRFSQGFAKIGLIPDGGSTWLLPRLVGPALAFELIYTAREVHAEEALKVGLCSRVLPTDELLPATQALAAQIAAGPPLAHARARALVQAGLHATLDEALGREMTTQLELVRTADFMEGVAAFMMKRPPQFKGE